MFSNFINLFAELYLEFLSLLNVSNIFRKNPYTMQGFIDGCMAVSFIDYGHLNSLCVMFSATSYVK